MDFPRMMQAAAACALLAGCDIPTEPPIFEPRWVVPVEETTVSVDDLLPSAVTVVGDAFSISVDPVSAVETLGALCGGPCDAVNGLVAPAPAFQGTFASTQSLPADVGSAEITAGSIDVAITNGFSFDPLAGGGILTISVADEGTGALLGQIEIDGSTTPLPAGATTMASLEIEPGTVTGGLTTTTEVDSPGGEVAEIDTSDEIHVVASVTALLVNSVTVDVPSLSVTLDQQSLDLEDIDESIANRIVSGGIILDVDNPFAVSVDGALDIGATSKGFSIAGGGASAVELSYTGDELRSFIGQPGVTLSGSGIANGTSVTIRPGQVMTLNAKLDFTLQIG